MIYKNDSVKDKPESYSNDSFNEHKNLQKSKMITLRVNEKKIEEWDRFRKNKLGNMTRTALIINSIEIYRLVMDNQMTVNETGIETQINQIDSIIQMLNTKLNLLKEEDKKIEEEIKSIDKNEIYGFKEISEKILELIDKWGKIPIEAITEHLHYPNYLIYTALQKLKQYKKVKAIDGEWELYDRK